MNESATSLLPLALAVAVLPFWGYCLVDFSHTSELEMRTFTRPVWLVILVLGSVAGGGLWLAVGRPQRPRR